MTNYCTYLDRFTELYSLCDHLYLENWAGIGDGRMTIK